MSNYVWGDSETQFFFELTPDVILDSIEGLGFQTTGRCLSLNSFENRVYEIEYEIEDKNESIVAKFYRPGRWNEKQILQEHEFMQDLVSAEVPIVSNLIIESKTLFKTKKNPLFFCLYPKKGGRHHQEMSTEQLEILGRSLARLHNTGSIKKADHRIKISPETFGLKNLDYILNAKLIPHYLEKEYQSVVENICSLSQSLFANVDNIRIHGDCHLGNIIWRDEGMHFIDFDDMLIGPAIQDIWPCIGGNDQYAKQDQSIILTAYEEFRDFNNAELKLIEPLRALRFIHFNAWIGKRMKDPAFVKPFEFYGTDQYWQTQVHDLKHQLHLIKNSLQADTYNY